MLEGINIYAIIIIGLLIFNLISYRRILKVVKENKKSSPTNKSVQLSKETVNNIVKMINHNVQQEITNLKINIMDKPSSPPDKKGKTEPESSNSTNYPHVAAIPTILTETGKKTSLYNKIRMKKLSEDTLAFKRVRLEFIDGSSLSDLGRERLFEEHSSGNCIVVITSDGKILLFPHFRKKSIDEDLIPYFKGNPEFKQVSKPAICEQVDNKYKVLEKGMLQ